MPEAVKLDLGLFSTEMIAKANPEHKLEVRKQIVQPTNENFDSNGNPAWSCMSQRSSTTTTLRNYASYQARSFLENQKVRYITKMRKEM